MPIADIRACGVEPRHDARVREMLMMLDVGVVVISGPLSSPRERGPDLFPVPTIPEVGADIPTMICGRSVDAKQLRLQIS